MSDTCVGCDNLELPSDGGHCYMFATAPTDGFCGQHTAVQRAIRSSPTLTKIILSAAVLAAIRR